MTDNDSSCQQICSETVQMDAVVTRASQPVQSAAVAADPYTHTDAQMAGTVAQVAVVQNAARSGFGGSGNFGGGSLLAGQQFAAQQTQAHVLLAQQAQGRKEHLTTLFLSKGCKLADIQK